MKFPVSWAGMVILGTCLTAMAQTNSGLNQKKLLMADGWLLAQEQYLAGMDVSDGELACFLNGFSAGAQDQKLPPNQDGIFQDVNALAKARQERVIAAIKRRNGEAAQQFLTHWHASGPVTDLPDGVDFTIVKAGNGGPATPMQTVTVHYFARLINGTEITEFGPDDLILVTNHLSQGLFEGFQKIGVGGKMTLYLPPDRAQGLVDIAGAPPGSALVYDIDLVGIKDTPASDLADALVPPAPDAPPPPYSGRFATNDVIMAWGWEQATRVRLGRLLLNGDELTNLLTGLETGIRNQPLDFDAETLQPQIEQFINERKQHYQEAFKEKQIAAMKSLFATLSKDTNVVELPDGLRYEIMKRGNTHFPRTGDIVLVNYTGQTLNGHVFDQTVNEPLHVEIGRVIPGWSEGIQKISIGGKIKLYIPPWLGYGGDAVSGIPANSTLIYDIELLDIQKKSSDSDTAATGEK